MPSETKIAVSDLTVHYGVAEALRGISMEIRTNEIFTIIGPANSGKSSLLLAINRMIERIPGASVTGQIRLDGESVNQIRDVQELRRRVGMVAVS